MLPEQLMFQKIRDFANQRPDILAAYMNGSRTNSCVPKDLYQDYDLVYVVQDIAPYIEDKSWIAEFGTIAVMQEPDLMDAYAHAEALDCSKRYAFLMQFTNGDRIDLTFQVPELAKTACLEDPLCIRLFDKTGVLPEIPPASDASYHVQKPSQLVFYACCNEFWWVAPYVAKGLWRSELLYAIDALNSYVRPQLLKMLSWQVGAATEFSLSVGKACKYLPPYLSEKDREQLTATYPPLQRDAIWEALFAACRLMGSSAHQVASRLNLTYDEGEEQRCLQHLQNVRENRYQLEK